MKSQLASVPFHNLSLMATEVFMVPIFEDESKKRKKLGSNLILEPLTCIQYRN